MIDWNIGYSSTTYAAIVDPASWRDAGRFEITGGKVSRSDSDLIESADVNCINYPYTGQERWIRLWMNVDQGGDSEHVPLFTGLATSPAEELDYKTSSSTLECYSVLKPAEDILLQRGWYAPAGMPAGMIIRQLLQSTPAPVLIEAGTPELETSIVAENNETNLSMVRKLLDAIGWRCWIHGDGTVHIGPQADTPAAVFDAVNNDSLEPKLKVKHDWFKCPNVFRAIKDDLYATARDDSPDSFLSTVSRGREVWAEESGCKLNKDESLGEYARRKLREKQAVAYSISYDRRFDPSVFVCDLVRLSYPGIGIDGTFRVVRQNVKLGYAPTVSEEVELYEL